MKWFPLFPFCERPILLAFWCSEFHKWSAWVLTGTIALVQPYTNESIGGFIPGKRSNVGILRRFVDRRNQMMGLFWIDWSPAARYALKEIKFRRSNTPFGKETRQEWTSDDPLSLCCSNPPIQLIGLNTLWYPFINCCCCSNLELRKILQLNIYIFEKGFFLQTIPSLSRTKRIAL